MTPGPQGGRLTTHVLDTALGKPAAGLAIDFYEVQGNHRQLLAKARTNADGRCDQPLLAGAAMIPGRYELHFYVGDYLRAHGTALPDPAFLDIVPIAFGIADAGAHYHVPLLVSPYGYSTYRGS